MAIYKEVDELLKAMDTWDKYGVSFGLFRLNKSNEKDYVPYVRYEDMVQAVTGTPHADVAPVKHGYWKANKDESGYFDVCICSECLTDFGNDISWLAHDMELPLFCPMCGAKMNEG